jgi:hypothetical protein
VTDVDAKGLAKRIIDRAGRAMAIRRSGSAKSVDAATSDGGRLLPSDNARDRKRDGGRLQRFARWAFG